MASVKSRGDKVAVIGCGFIGKNWAMIFASAGYNVSIYDLDKSVCGRALDDILYALEDHRKSGSLRGSLTPTEQVLLISVHDSLSECVKDAVYVQECIFERLELKKSIFADLDQLASTGMILASSSSAMPASLFTSDMSHRCQTLVCHPVNQPYLVPTVEVVPAPYTDTEIFQRTMVILKDIGQSPVHIKKELPGFVQPRVQYAMIQECWKLVLEGYISAEDVDKIMTDGLGMRYAFMGPFETIHLNGEGMNNYTDRYGDMIERISSVSGPARPMLGDEANEAFEEIAQWSPLNKLQGKRNWRYQRMAALVNMKNNMDAKDQAS